MASAIGWYGPLIDLSEAALHIGDFVQLLVFVHRSTPVHYKLPKGGEVIRTDVNVGDDTRSFFPVSIWQKQIGSMAIPGDIILLQNVKIAKYGNVLEARTVQCSSVLCLVHTYEAIVSGGADSVVADSRVGVTAKQKLRKVLQRVQRAGTVFPNGEWHSHQPNGHNSRNWRLIEDRKTRYCVSLSEVSRLNDSCRAVFHAFIGEIFLPFSSSVLCEPEKEKMFISRRIYKAEEGSLAQDLICSGCQLCGSTLEGGSSVVDQKAVVLYCAESSNHGHHVGLIYRPFMLYVWDDSEYIPVLVRNKAAELLFGNIKAERVFSCFRKPKKDQRPDQGALKGGHLCGSANLNLDKLSGVQEADSGALVADKKVESKKAENGKNFDSYLIWLVLLRLLLQQGKNNPLKFEVSVNTSLDKGSGRFEMVNVWMPCFN